MSGEKEALPIYDAAMKYQAQAKPLVIFAVKEYGTGSSRDWAAKGTMLLGVKAVIAESFERIHRSNLAGMGVLPLQFTNGVSRKSLGLTGDETISLTGLSDIATGIAVTLKVQAADGTSQECELLCRLDTALEVDYFKFGGIMPYVVSRLLET
jgi:aconitate hydratase